MEFFQPPFQFIAMVAVLGGGGGGGDVTDTWLWETSVDVLWDGADEMLVS